MEKEINQDMVKQFGTKAKEAETPTTPTPQQNVEWINTKDYKYKEVKFMSIQRVN